MTSSATSSARAWTRLSPVAVRGIIIGVVLALLETAPRVGVTDALTMVPLSEMIAALGELFSDDGALAHLASTAGLVAVSFTLACLSGLPMGYWLARSDAAFRMLSPYLTSYYAVPFFAFYPMLIAIFGMNSVPIVLLAWTWAVAAVTISTANGLRRVPKIYRKVAATYQLSRWSSFWRIEVPAASSVIFNGFKLAITYSVLAVVASEFILATEGLGWMVSYFYNSFAVAKMYAAIALVVGISTLVLIAINAFQNRVRGAKI